MFSNIFGAEVMHDLIRIGIEEFQIYCTELTALHVMIIIYSSELKLL